MSEQTKAWIKLITLALSAGIGLGATSYVGGAKLGYSIIVGVGAAAQAVYHSLSPSPQDSKPTNGEPKP